MAIQGGLHVFAKLIIVTGATLLVLGIIGLVVVAHSNDYYCGKQGYGVVFDAGSSHTSMAIYQWLEETTNGTGIASEVVYVSDCTEDGIATHPDDQAAIAAGLEQCLDTAKLAVPDFSHTATPVYLGATAGMRILAETFPAKTETILKTVRKTLADTSFHFTDEKKQARILSGNAEGKDGWVSANYLAGNLGVNSGYSSELSNPCSPIGYSYTVSGANIWKAPCSSGPTDMEGVIFTFNGTSDPEQCYNATKTLFDFGAQCDDPPCSIDGVHSPPPFGSFKAFSGFAYTSNAIGLSSTPTPSEFLEKSRDYCLLTLDELNRLPEQFRFKIRFCFQGMYIRILLLEAFKFEQSNWDMEFTLKVNNVELGWSLGYMVDATNRLPEEMSCVGLAQANLTVLIIMWIVISLFGLLLVMLGIKISGRSSSPHQSEVV